MLHKSPRNTTTFRDAEIKKLTADIQSLYTITGIPNKLNEKGNIEPKINKLMNAKRASK